VLRKLLAAAAALLATFAGVAVLALESGGVAVLGTRAPDGTPRETRVWVAEGAGALWLEAATPERPWYRDVLLDPVVSLERDGHAGAYRALPETGEAARRRLRGWLRERYGWRDAFVGLLQDTSRSVAVRLEPLR
jgi:hypothetical protein